MRGSPPGRTLRRRPPRGGVNMNKTGIGWTDATWNPATGCTKCPGFWEVAVTRDADR